MVQTRSQTARLVEQNPPQKQAPVQSPNTVTYQEFAEEIVDLLQPFREDEIKDEKDKMGTLESAQGNLKVYEYVRKHYSYEMQQKYNTQRFTYATLLSINRNLNSENYRIKLRREHPALYKTITPVMQELKTKLEKYMADWVYL